MKQKLKEYCDWLEDLTIAGDTINSKGLQKWITEYAKEYHTKQLNLTNVVERLPIGEIIKLIDNEYFKGFTGELKITGHCSYMGKKVGHLVNGEGIFLIEDFVR
mgnify:CR=1 FL=1